MAKKKLKTKRRFMVRHTDAYMERLHHAFFVMAINSVTDPHQMAVRLNDEGYRRADGKLYDAKTTVSIMNKLNLTRGQVDHPEIITQGLPFNQNPHWARVSAWAIQHRHASGVILEPLAGQIEISLARHDAKLKKIEAARLARKAKNLPKPVHQADTSPNATEGMQALANQYLPSQSLREGLREAVEKSDIGMEAFFIEKPKDTTADDEAALAIEWILKSPLSARAKLAQINKLSNT